MEKIEELKGNLRSEDYGVRRFAAEELGRLQAKEAVSELAQALGDDKWDVRKAGATALGNIGEKEAVPALLPLLKDSDWFVREAAAVALGKLGDKSAAAALQECLQDGVYSVSKAADSALRKLGVEISQPADAPAAQAAAEKQTGKKTTEKESSSRDRIVSVSQELGASLATIENGFRLRVEVGKGRHQTIEVWFEQDQMVYQTTCGPATPDNYLWALKTNYTVECGSLAVVDIESQPAFVVVERQLEETADMEEIRRAIWTIATFGDWVEEALTKEDKR
jgi:hypothetical protein